MKVYSAPRQAGKTLLAINKASQYVSDGYEVYLISPTYQTSEILKKMTSKYFNKDIADKIHFIPAGKVFDGKSLTGFSKRRAAKIIFDDGDISLNAFLKERFGAYAELDLFTCTEDWMSEGRHK